MKKKNQKKSPSRRTLRIKLVNFVLIMLCIYFAYSILSTQIQVYKERKALEEVNRQIEEAQLENDEMMRILSGGQEQYIERIAREKLGYAEPGEIVVKDR